MRPYFSEYFKKQLKKMMKKYPLAKEDFLHELDHLDLTREISIGRNVYKIRIKNSDMKKGKSGGYRAYLYCYRKNEVLVPLCLYSKSDQENLHESELQWHIDRTLEELVGKYEH